MSSASSAPSMARATPSRLATASACSSLRRRFTRNSSTCSSSKVHNAKSWSSRSPFGKAWRAAWHGSGKGPRSITYGAEPSRG
eukprot:4461238-Pyramimonas_sp.AAC.1